MHPRHYALGAATAAALALAATSAEAVVTLNSDDEFKDRFGSATEYVQGELRGGNQSGSGAWELGIVDLDPSYSPITQSNFAWEKGTQYSFTFEKSGDELSLTLGDNTNTNTITATNGFSLENANSI